MGKRNTQLKRSCPFEAAMEMLGEKWIGTILFHLGSSPKRFSELQKLMPQITARMLSMKLHKLEADALIVRIQHSSRNIEYALSEKGLKLNPILLSIKAWIQH